MERGAHISQVQQRQRTIAPADAPPPHGKPKGFTWAGYRDLIIAAHRQLPGTPSLVWCWDTLNIYLAPALADFAAENKEWLRIYRLPTYAPDHVHSEFNLVTAPNRILAQPSGSSPGSTAGEAITLSHLSENANRRSVRLPGRGGITPRRTPTWQV